MGWHLPRPPPQTSDLRSAEKMGLDGAGGKNLPRAQGLGLEAHLQPSFSVRFLGGPGYLLYPCDL